ncbi:MAG: helix-turn-helix transcriptional regulator, partial [Moorea sp. SIO1G6]|uniref:winged helix-turn-helix domain-containing protein n=1 Tax=Moorena sp. SIO1G6 TaxID=2607840 RepID=UPI0013C166A6
MEPEAERSVLGVDAIRTYAHPLRLQILKQMQEPTTVKQVASRLDQQPTKLHYHVKLLHEHELIQVVAQNSVNGIAEHVYQVTARDFRLINPMVSSDGFSEDTASAIFTDMLQETTLGLQRALAAHEPVEGEIPRDPFVSQKSFRLSDSQLTEFHQRLVELIQDVTAFQVENQELDEPL